MYMEIVLPEKEKCFDGPSIKKYKSKQVAVDESQRDRKTHGIPQCWKKRKKGV